MAMKAANTAQYLLNSPKPTNPQLKTAVCVKCIYLITDHFGPRVQENLRITITL